MKSFIKDNAGTFFIYMICISIFLLIFRLYHLPLKGVIYPSLLCLFIIFIYLGFKYIKYNKKHKKFSYLKKLPENLIEELEEYTEKNDEDYKDIIKNLLQENRKLTEEYMESSSDMENYYSAWVHQIKTPMSAMYLNLQKHDSELSRELTENLFSIEQYVDMALCYVRLESSSTDYMFRKYNINNILRESIRRLSNQFINKGISLEYKMEDYYAVTDEKWLSFVIEQIMTNALKYTSKGSISVYMEKDLLCIKDTGIGINKENLPRIFEKGFTGFNGRTNGNASGIGLYLCKTICDRLGHGISAESELNNGTTIKIDFSQQDFSYN